MEMLRMLFTICTADRIWSDQLEESKMSGDYKCISN
jgi:hypothetical protein